MDKETYEPLTGRSSAALKEELQGLSTEEKGPAFERALAELYRGNGWIVSVQGGRGDEGADILLSHPKTPHTVSLIVQAKNHNRPLTLDQTRSELIKFEQQAAERYKCQQFRLVAVNGFVAEARKLSAFNLLLDSWGHVDALLTTYSPDKKALPEIELYAHNRMTYGEVINLWEETNQVGVVQATGTGKSFLIAKALTDFHGVKKIVLAPSHYILEQQKATAPWVNENTYYWTYAGLARKSEAEIKALEVSLIVLDEFHRCGADVWGAGVQKLLDIHPEAKVLGTTATPIRYLDESRDMAEELFDGAVATDLSLAEAIVKRILPVPTYISALYTLDEEIRNLLEEVEASRRTEEEKKQLRQEINASKLEWEKTSGVPDILKNNLPKGINKLIVFCKDQEHLDQMEVEVQKWFQKAGTHKWREKYRVLSADPESKNNLNRFKEATGKDTVHLLFVIDMLNEGLHIPEVGAVILLRPTESPTIFYQQIGRCIEVGKNHSPIIFDFVNNFQNIRASDFLNDLEEAKTEENRQREKLELESYAPSFHVIEHTLKIEEVFEAIRERLISWEVQYENLCAFKEKHGHCKVPQIYPDNPSFGLWVGKQRRRYKKGLLSEDRIRRLIEIGFVWDSIATIWEEMFTVLIEFKEKHGHCKVPYRYQHNPFFGRWVGKQKENYKAGLLSEGRIRRLTEIGFVWNSGIITTTIWENRFKSLMEFKEKHGHCRVPQVYPDNPSFGLWVNHQRQSYKKELLSEDHIRRLTEIGFVWDPSATIWEEMFTVLMKFKEKNGHLNGPYNYPDNPSFGSWVGTQKQSYKKGLLSKDRTRRLEDIGFVWNSRGTTITTWEEKFMTLIEFKEKHGHCDVPFRCPDNPSFGRWVGKQKQSYKKGLLSKDRTRRLEDIGFVWNSRGTTITTWEEKFMTLIEFKEKHGHCKVPQIYPDNPSFGLWVGKQRRRYKKGLLSEDCILKLTAMGFIWNPINNTWEEMFTALIEFKEKRGHCNVPKRYHGNLSLGYWVSKQRQNYKKGLLSEDRIRRLEEIGFVWSLNA